MTLSHDPPVPDGEVLAPIFIPRRFEGPLLGRGRAVLDSGKYIDLEATIEDWETHEVVATATARFLPMRSGA